MASLVLGVAGAAVGSYFGYASLGWSIGSMLGNSLFAPHQPTINQQGPRLSDLKVQSSMYGNPIPVVYGTSRLAGNVIWATNITETSHTSSHSSGGKGGGGGGKVKSTSYSYSQSFAVALCEGPIIGIRKIWANGALIYSVADTADVATIRASNAAATGITVHTGSETQTADSLIQANIGVSNTPAYRGTAYVVFNNLQLADFGNRMPNLEFEVVAAGAGAAFVGTAHTLPSVHWNAIAWNGYGFCAVGYAGTGVVATSPDGIAWTQRNTIGSVFWNDIAWNGTVFCAVGYLVNGIVATSPDGITWTTRTTPVSPAWNAVIWNGTVFCVVPSTTANVITSPDGITWTNSVMPVSPACVDIAWNGSVFCGISTTTMAVTSPDGRIWTQQILPSSGYKAIAWNGTVFCAVGSATNAATSPDGITWTSHATVGSPAYNDIAWNGTVFCAITDTSLMETSPDGITWTPYTLPGSGYLGIVWNGAIFCAVPGGSGSVNIIPYTLTTSSVTLASIVTDICTRASLTTGQIDVSALTDNVDGYIVQRSSARSQLESLMQAFYVDAVESDGKAKFVKRGNAPVASIVEDDLAAHVYGGAMPDNLTLDRKQEMELPIEVNVQYLDNGLSYLINSQRSQRLTTSSVNKLSINLALSMSATKAKQIADVLMYEAWTSRTSFGMAQGWKYSYLEPTDVVQVTKGSRTYTVRIGDEDASHGVYSRSAVLEDSSVYTQTAAAVAGVAPSETITGVPILNLALMDLPLLRDIDDGVGFYAAACGYSPGWGGAQIFKSTDGGSTWNSFGSALLNEGTIGTASSVLGDFTGRANIFDEGNSVTVYMYHGALSSDTEINVLNGSNVALLGSEIIQFKNASLIATNTYQLTGLLRGRQGTDRVMGTHAAGEAFVLLGALITYLETSPSTEYNLSRQYKGVSLGGFLDDAPILTFSNTASAQKPYTPVQLGGGRNAANDVILSWIRRTRISGAWNNLSDVPLGEASEAYVVEIYSSNTYATLKRTITGITSPTTTYTAAQQTADGLTPGNPVYFIVYQVSATVGNGYGARGAV